MVFQQIPGIKSIVDDKIMELNEIHVNWLNLMIHP